MTLPKEFTPDRETQILQRLGEIDAQAAASGALYSPGGLFDAKRKNQLALRKEVIRAQFVARNEKVTDGRLDDMAHEDPEYTKWLDKQVADRIAWLLLDGERDRLYAELRVIEAQGRRGR